MITWNYIITRLRVYEAANGVLNSFGAGDADKIISRQEGDESYTREDLHYPLLWADIEDFLPDLENGKKTDFRISLYLLDMVLSDGSNKENVISDMATEALDVIQWLKTDGADKGYRVSQVRNVTKINDQSADILAGWMVQLTITGAGHPGNCYLNV